MNNLLLTEKMESILNRRIKSKRRVTSLDFLDRIHRFEICEHPVLINRMYAFLLSGKLSKEGFQAFFNDYYYASCHGFFWVVLRQALDAYNNKTWRSYIKSMLAEENRPCSHADLLKKFIEDCGMKVGESVVSQKFIDDMVKGFTTDICFALGYSLAIEVEGAYQIDLIQESCSSLFSEQLKNTVWFDIHLDSTGEEEHANYAVEVIEEIVDSELGFQKLHQGFIKGCDDTFNFMESLFKHVDSLSEAKLEVVV
ncbi:MAG: hypothetical protein QNJ49_19535 [Mastigocoleus sp. MO_167.B18]|nr:hypothetical protein [Mastigocoleus sp. MO_167.B18]